MYEMNRLPQIIERKWWYGGPRDFWLKNIDRIQDIIKEFKVKPIEAEHLDVGYFETVNMTTKSLIREENIPEKIRRPSFPGGMRIPHLHFKGDIYLLEREAWEKFSGQLIQDLRMKLEKVNSINFEQAVEISETINSLG